MRKEVKFEAIVRAQPSPKLNDMNYVIGKINSSELRDFVGLPVLVKVKLIDEIKEGK